MTGFAGMNLYQYCGNNPIMYTDSNGEWFIIDDILTGPIDEIIILGGIAIFELLFAASVDGTSALQEEPDLFPEIELMPPSDKKPIPFEDLLPVPKPEEPSREKPKAKYYEAMLMEPGIMVFVVPSMNADEAKAFLLKGGDVWTSLESDAKLLAIYVSGGYIDGRNEKNGLRWQKCISLSFEKQARKWSSYILWLSRRYYKWSMLRR